MSLSKLDTDFWLELDQNYTERIQQRRELFRLHGTDVLAALPGSELACKELMETALQFILTRYPHHFTLAPDASILHNHILNTTTHLPTTPPLHVLLHNIPEDFALTLRSPTTGLYTLRAGIIMSALGWSLGTKLGLALHEIHAPIPHYEDKMRRSMDRYFAKLPTSKPIQRGSWGVEVGRPLYVPPDHPHHALRERQDPATRLADCHLRVDWQTLRRLPLMGAVAFNFKGLFTPVEEFRDEPGIPALLGKVSREGEEGLMAYKGTWHTRHVVLPALEAWEREQRERGVVGVGWEVATLGQSPFFPGWEGKWKVAQGVGR